YMADWLPINAREILLLLPMVHSVEVIREGFFGGVVRYHYDMGYMAMCNLGLTLTGLWLVRDASYRVEAE
ncbi:MAG: capsule polysaccharide export ABC transporter permease, partial [Rubrivivax sp.]|nr:capsule polysaccharide export ABC transporter permease [Rubrivivax sp.]